MTMPLPDFLEHADALFRRDLPDAPSPFSKSHIFNLGADQRIEEGIREIWEDLKVDMRERIPLPFSDTACVSLVKNSTLKELPEGWILDRIIDLPVTQEDWDGLQNIYVPEDATPAQREAMKKPRQKLLVVRCEEGSDTLIVWKIAWFGVADGAMVLVASPTTDLLAKLGGKSSPIMDTFLDNESRAVIKQAAAISHPGNYVVQVTPSLTPKEERKVAQGRERPIRKMPHFIVVDHDVLVSMNPSRQQGGVHASPVPHERRGHWMRLAERCRRARLEGKEKVWVRPAYVGERVFTDGKNHYEVLMDFGKKEEALVS